MTRTPEATLVAACGNTDAGDDGFGPAVVEALRRRPLPGLAAITLGPDTTGLLDRLPGRDRLIVVDAVVAPDAAPDALLELEWPGDDARRLWRPRTLSSHGVSVLDQLELARGLSMLPPSVVLLLAPLRCAAVGSAISAPVRSLVTDAVAAIGRLAAKPMSVSQRGYAHA